MKSIFFILLTFTLFITSCKKEEYQPQPLQQPHYSIDSAKIINEYLTSYFGKYVVDSVLSSTQSQMQIFKNDKVSINSDNTITIDQSVYQFIYTLDSTSWFGSYTVTIDYAPWDLFIRHPDLSLIPGISEPIYTDGIIISDGNAFAYCHKVDFFNVDLIEIK